MTEHQQIEAGIAALEAQRGVLGDALVDLAVAPLRARLAALGEAVQPRPEQALKQVSVLFTDVVGSTSLSQHLDPEDIHAIMDGALQRFTVIVQDRGGRVLQYAGDSVLAVFGADEAQEDDAERAVRAGLEVLDEGRRQGEQVLQQTGHAGFNVRVGIDTGPVLLGGGVDAESSIRGITVNTAARMEQSAPPGCLRISHATYRLVRGVFTVAEQPPLQVKGRDEALVTYLVQGVKPRAFRVQSRGIEGVETRMVGRESELEQLQEIFDSLYQQRTLAVVTVVGDAGVGKSRLLYEFENWAEAHPESFYFFRGRAHPQTQTQPYGLLRDVLAWRLQIADDDDADEARAKLCAGVSGMFTEDGEAQAHLLGQLIGLDFSGSPHVRGILDDARQIRNRGFHAAAQLLRLTAALDGSPVMLLLEDLHWADDGSLDFINYLMQVDRDVPMLMVCLTRPALFERRPGWAEVGGAGHARIDLEPLDQRASRELAGVLLQRLDRVPPVLRELLTGGAEGNPFYMEELLRMLIDHGAIQTSGERWQVMPEKLLATQVPPSLTGVLQARLDRLPAAERQALQLASVIGFVFWDQALAALDPLAADALEAPVQRGLVVPRDQTTFDGLREYSFKHQLLHHVAYDSVLKRDRREGHARVAHWLASLGGDRTGEILGQTAEHYERAADPVNACLFYTRAAEHAAARFANEAVLDYVGRALALAPAEDRAIRWRLLLVREGVLLFKGDRVAHDADLDALQSLAEALDDDARRCEVALRRGRAFNSTSDYPAAEQVVRQALAMGGPDGAVAVQLHSTLVTALRVQGDYAGARQVAEEGLELARKLGDRSGESSLINAIGVMAMEQGDLTVAAQSLERSLVLERETGNRAREGLRLNNLGSVYPRLGDYTKARQHLADGLKLARAVGRREVEAGVLLNTASVAHLQGDDASALAYANAAFDAAKATVQPDLEAYARLVAGHAELGLGRFDAARAAYSDSHDRLGALKIRSQQALDPLSGLVRVALAEGKPQEARQLAEPIVAHLTAGGSLDGTEEPLLIPLSCYQALSAAGDPRAAELLAAAHAELLLQADRITDPVARRGFLQLVPHHREISAAWSSLQPTSAT
ncbi:ATP-binding protein [Rivibacter subsaxonicus]|uniref:Putative ATPase n=1 Tax=Rivibacter subsaxonicus TaxID=457575 RepID=A0A4Q7VDH6_9BURK|nr:adenylate/guanylate cyclase domain-containing protein [Rivibacter subsaxonicus]RZT93790.1 putative ATPase [Rivibacter subsaxonicus]